MSRYVYVGGTFDLFHAGHVELLRKASLYGPVVAIVNDDAFAASYKRAPIMSLAERLSVVRACRYVDEADVNIGGADSKPSILCWHPAYIAHGSDWTGDSFLTQLGVDEDFLAAYRIKLLYLPYTAGVSTSDVIERCRR